MEESSSSLRERESVRVGGGGGGGGEGVGGVYVVELILTHTLVIFFET